MACTVSSSATAAVGIGARVGRLRAAAIAVCVVPAGIAVATVGPTGFLALAAQRLVRRLARAPGIALMPAMSMGALILMAADLLAQRLLTPFSIPVEQVTAAGGVPNWSVSSLRVGRASSRGDRLRRKYGAPY